MRVPGLIRCAGGGQWWLPLAFLLSLLAGACQSGGSSDPAGTPVAGGGIGGTGKGTITNFIPPPTAPASLGAAPLAEGGGSITLNALRTFNLTSSTEFRIDDDAVDAAALAAQAEGMVARVDVGMDVDPAFTSGTAVRVVAEHALIGPVTGTGAALAVLGQPVLVTAQTVLRGLPNPESLIVGDLVEVSGNISAGGTVQATRLELETVAPAAWRITGTVAGLVPGTSFLIGSQNVQFAGATLSDCGSGPADGVPVKVTVSANQTYVDAAVGATPLPALVATRVECVRPGIELPPELTSGTLHVELEGFVTATDGAVPPVTFEVNGQVVQIISGTVYENGGVTDLVIGARVEVVGSLDIGTGVLTASRIEFSEHRVRIIAPVTAMDAHTMTLLGIAVMITPLTEDDEQILGGGMPTTQVEVNGFTDGTHVFATEIKTKGNAVSDPVRLRGPVTDIGTDDFAVLGITIDPQGARLLDRSEVLIDWPTFLASLTLGDQVDVEDGSFDGVLNTISGANQIEIED